MTKKLLSLFAVSAVLSAQVLTAAADENSLTSTDDAGSRLLMTFLNDVRTLSSGFEQKLVDADGNVVDDSSGTVEISRPGRFRWSYMYPYEQLLIADGLNVWSYDVDLEQVTVKPQADALGSTPALLLGGARDVLEEFDYTGYEVDENTTWVTLRPKSTENGFNRVELGFNDGRLTRMLFADNLEQTTLIVLFNTNFNVDIDAARFQFAPPAGIDVVGEAIVADVAED